ncbi:hypothetical protein LDENG_00216480 [Lucifuga dentata]|nr:hypothetical protein LDENG_00216480 [Lucifuga dentata]
MTGSISQELLCYPGYNASCVRVQVNVGTCVALYFVLGFGILVTIVGNFLVILSVAHFKHMRNPTNVMIMSLALVDLLVGVVVMPFSSIRTVYGCWFYGDDFCLFHSCFDMFLSTLSIFHLVCIAVDRYQAICNPLHYSQNITMPVAWITVCGCWALAAFYSYALLYTKANVAGLEDYLESIYCVGSCNLLFNSLWGVLDSIICFFFPCTVMVCLYTKIFLVAKEHRIQMTVEKAGWLNSQSTRQSEHKAAKTLSIVISAFIFCWLPFFIISIIDAHTGFTSPVELFEIFYWLGYFNSTLNPIIYALFYPCFRKCFNLIVTLKIFSDNS